MDEIGKLREEVSDLRRRVHEMLRLAQVTAVDADASRLTCVCEGLEQPNIPFLTMRAGEDQTYWLPSVGELGILASLSGNPANAFFVPGIYYEGVPAAESNEDVSLRVFRDGMEERIDTAAHSYKMESGNTSREMDRSEIKDTVGMNEEVLSAIGKSLLGAILYATGLTTLQSPAGPVMFAPMPLPSSPPSPPVGSLPNADGQATKIPATTTSGISILFGSSILLPAIPVTTSGGAGFTTLGTYTITGTLNLQFPARTL